MARPNSICIIPARAGSKSIKDKNLTRLNGKTLVRIALEKAVKSMLFSKIVISTDYPKHKLDIEDIGSTVFTQIIFHKRRPGLCTDDAPMKEVVKDVSAKFGGNAPYIWIMQVTCPYTLVDDMQRMNKIMLGDPTINSLISFKEVKEHSNRTYSLKEKETFMEAYKLRYTNYKNRQDLFPQHIRSGNIYIVSKEAFDKSGYFETKPIAAYIVPRHIGTNIDDQEDLVLAKWLLSSGKVTV